MEELLKLYGLSQPCLHLSFILNLVGRNPPLGEGNGVRALTRGRFAVVWLWQIQNLDTCHVYVLGLKSGLKRLLLGTNNINMSSMLNQFQWQLRSGWHACAARCNTGIARRVCNQCSLCLWVFARARERPRPPPARVCEYNDREDRGQAKLKRPGRGGVLWRKTSPANHVAWESILIQII